MLDVNESYNLTFSFPTIDIKQFFRKKFIAL